MRVLVMCTVHDPRDARISERQIAALLAAGHTVTQAGPFTAFGATSMPGVQAIDLPRAHGRHRVRAWWAARRLLHRTASEYDVILIHSPELIPAAVGLDHTAVVWDVHEDTASTLAMKSWLPQALRGPIAAVVRRAEASAERRAHVMLAERAYAERFALVHPVVPNTPLMPSQVVPSSPGRAIYVGSLTAARGVHDLIDVGRRLSEQGEIRLDVIGPAAPAIALDLRAAQAQGWLTWRGFIPNAEALRLMDGATVGLSLLHDQPNYRHSMPTKLLEYLARGIPFISTPLPLAVDLATASGGGIIVPFGDAAATTQAVRTLHDDDRGRQALADQGHAWVVEHADWGRDGPAFVAQLEEWAATRLRP